MRCERGSKLCADGTLTCDGEVDPGAVGVGVVGALQEHDRALVPALVTGPHAADLDRGVVQQSDASLVVGVDVRRQPVQLDEDGHLHALLVPLDHVLAADEAGARLEGRRRRRRIGDVALEHRRAAERRRLAD